MIKLLIASRNNHKVRELRSFLRGFDIEVLTMNDFPSVPSPPEDGSTFQENAFKKASNIHSKTGLTTLADDSGLEVFFLNGRPGVRSARYAGDNASDDDNNRKLLGEMKGVAPRRRKAQFRAALSLIGSGFAEHSEGVCEGRLGEEPRGSNGFGYDPIFVPAGFSKTYAELSTEEKNIISHRARAFSRMKEILTKRLG